MKDEFIEGQNVGRACVHISYPFENRDGSLIRSFVRSFTMSCSLCSRCSDDVEARASSRFEDELPQTFKILFCFVFIQTWSAAKSTERHDVASPPPTGTTSPTS